MLYVVLMMYGTSACAAEDPLSSRDGSFAAAPAKGMFLVAGENLSDSNFARTVVLIVEHDEDGTLGVVVNRPTGLLLREAMSDLPGLSVREDRLFLGGPVAHDRIVMLLRHSSDPVDARPVFEDVYFSASVRTLSEVVQDRWPVSRLMCLLGHAGWGAGQLEGELERGDWLLVPARVALIFSVEPEQLWEELIRRNSGRWVGLPVFPPSAGV